MTKNLLERGDPVVAFDLDSQARRLGQVLSPEHCGKLIFVQGDICDRSALEQTIAEHSITHVIHLAALQVPLCQADPVRGATVNVLGTLQVFEAALACDGQVERIVYASSAAVAGPPDDYDPQVFTSGSVLLPRTHYGVFKQCNEGNAAVYHQTRGVSSIGLRPWAVYGAGRDFGLTSDPTKAIKAAVLGRPFEIQFGGRVNMQYVDDVAKIFLQCADSELTGARVYNLQGEVLEVSAMVEIIESVVPQAKGLISFRNGQLPIVPDFDDRDLRAELKIIPFTPFEEGVRQTTDIFRRLRRENRLTADELGPPALNRA